MLRIPHIHIATDKSGLNRLLCFAKDRFALSVLYFKMNVGAKQGSDPDRNMGRCGASPHIHIATDKSGQNRIGKQVFFYQLSIKWR